MNLYFQFFIQDHTKAALELLRLPSLLFAPGAQRGKVKVSGGGHRSQMIFATIDSLTSRLAKRRWNQCEVIYDLPRVRIGKAKARVKIMNGVFTPPPSFDLWFPSEEFHVTGRASMHRQSNAFASEQGFRGLEIKRVPCVFEAALEMECPESLREQVLDHVAERLASVLSADGLGLEVFGCCDAGDRDLFVRLESNVLMIEHIRVRARISPEIYPKLEEKFVGLHPIMFGRKQACAGLVAELGKPARLLPVTGSSEVAVVRLGPDYSLSEVVEVVERARTWLWPTIK